MSELIVLVILVFHGLHIDQYCQAISYASQGVSDQCLGKREAEKSNVGSLHRSEKCEEKCTFFPNKVVFGIKIKNIKYA